MALISEVKCGKCDRMYSSLKARCPFCGARRNAAGKYARTDDNMKGKMIIGVAVLAVFLVAITVILLTATKESPDSNGPVGVTSPTPTYDIYNPESPDVTNPGDINVQPIESPSPPPFETPVPAVTAVKVQYGRHDLAGQSDGRPEFTLTKTEQTVKLSVVVAPEGILTELDIKPEWVSQNTSIFTVSPSADGLTATVYWIGSGSGLLTVTAGNQTATVSVHCNNR